MIYVYYITNFQEEGVHIRFHFVTKLLVDDENFKGRDVNHTLEAIERKEIPIPDIVIMNSCTWDLTRCI